MHQIRQGDVFFTPVSRIPKGAKKVKPENGLLILARGEASGHAHVLEATPEVELYEKDGVLYAKVKDERPVLHKHLPTDSLTTDHSTVTVPPGIHEIRIQKEVMPDGVVRPVLD